MTTMVCKCGRNWLALDPLDRFMRKSGELVCRWCLIAEGQNVLADPDRPPPAASK